MTISFRRGSDRFSSILLAATTLRPGSREHLVWLFLLAASLTALAGCGGSKEPQPEAANSAEAPAEVAADDAAPAEEPGAAVPEKGSPEWIVGEMIVLRSQPVTDSKDPKEIEKARQERHRKVIEMATGVIAKTHSDPAKETTFNGAVHFLVEARLQLALAGDTAERDSLFDDADSLYKRAPESKAAAEAAFAVARYAHTNAQLFAKKDQNFLAEFSKQARLFATNFPMQQARAAHLLLSAGKSCELHGMRSEALACYTMLQEKFAETPQSQQAVAILKRLNLEGQKLDLGGETPEGGFVKIDDYKGKVVLVVFWSSDSQDFQSQVADLSQVARKYESKGLRVIGVSLDEDETLVDAFVEKHPLPWTQIFSVDKDKRRWDNPVVKAYGVQDIPLYWLVDQNGTVVDSQVNPEELDTRVRTLLAKKTASAE
ncbi:MAG: peroxiredoxin family protein [Planctomycetaceae bacterium]